MNHVFPVDVFKALNYLQQKITSLLLCKASTQLAELLEVASVDKLHKDVDVVG